MSTERENKKYYIKLTQYKRNCWRLDCQAEPIFTKDYNINYQLETSKFLESYHPELIGYTALHITSDIRNKDIEFFLSRGADPMIKCQNGITPLHLVLPTEDYCHYLDHFYDIKSSCALLLSAQVKLGNVDNPRSFINALTHFHTACIANHTEAIEFFLKSGLSVDEMISIDSAFFAGYTPLHFTARFSSLEAMKLLLNNGANTQLKNTEGMTFIHTLIEARMEIIEPMSIYAPHSVYSHSELIDFLLQNDHNAIEHAGLTIFHLACFTTDVSRAEQLLPKIADINQALDMDAPKWSGYTALHFSAYSSLDMVKMLVKNGANIAAKDTEGVTPLDMCVEKYELEGAHSVLSLDENYKSILMSDRKTRLLDLIFAMKDVIQFENFIESRAYIVNTFIPHDSPIWQGFTPLHLAVKFYKNRFLIHAKDEPRDQRSEYIIKKLISLGANINVQDMCGRSPLNLSFRQTIKKNPNFTIFYEKRIRKATEFLLEVGEIENCVDKDDLSHLHIACKMQDKISVEKLLETNVNVNVTFKGKSEVTGIYSGMTPLHTVASNDEIANLLVACGADPLLKDAKGMTAIHHSGKDAVLSIPNLKDCVNHNTGVSHLHVAACRGNVAATKKLLDSGADMKQKISQKKSFFDDDNFVGYTPLDIAIEMDSKVIEVLLRHGAEILVDIHVPAKNIGTWQSNLKQFFSSLSPDDSLFKRLEKEIGLTRLHLACLKVDIKLIKELLNGGADVNAKINVNSRIWPGFTTCHMLINTDDYYSNEKLDEAICLLLDHGADVTMADAADGDTALHMMYYRTGRKSCKRCLSLKRMMRAQKDFSINPTRCDGTSHFFIACDIGDVFSVDKFLKCGVDVNQSVFFYKSDEVGNETSGRTPLHIVTGKYSAEDEMTQFKLVDLLLKHGADVDVEEPIRGETPLGLMAGVNWKREAVILRLHGSKANVNHRNIADQTPLERLVAQQDVTMNNINFFLNLGCQFNIFNPRTDKGLIATALALIPHEDQLCFITSSMVNFENSMQKDEMDRTVIHNIVSDVSQIKQGVFAITDLQYTALINEIENIDHKVGGQIVKYNVDNKNYLGRTPLHLAALFRNANAISGLLMAGADVNVTDANGNTPFSYIFQSCVRCSEKANLSDRNQNHHQYEHFNIFHIFITHIKKLLFCKLDVNQINQKLMFEAVEIYKSMNLSLPNLFEKQIKEMKKLKIRQSTLTLDKFLSEYEAVIAYPSLPEEDRRTVDEFFKQWIFDFRIEYSQVADILFLQYRKAIKRVDLNQSAENALNSLTKIDVPILCSRAILKFLTNSDLSSMIEATAIFSPEI